jgi:hypothetical protein
MKMNCFYPVFLLQLLSLLGFTSAQLQDPCYVCRRADRTVADPSKQFELTDIYGKTFSWTCGQLEENGKTLVLVSNTVCGIFIAHAEKNCDCIGPPIEPVGVVNENPACDICIDGRSVPDLKAEELVNTGVAGQMPCGFLYETAANGGMPAQLCPVIQENVNDFCCTIPAFDPDDPTAGDVGGDGDGTGTSTGGEDLCEDVHSECGNGKPCCGSYVCKIRQIGSPATCSVQSVRQRESVAASGRGGAGGRAKFVN